MPAKKSHSVWSVELEDDESEDSASRFFQEGLPFAQQLWLQPPASGWLFVWQRDSLRHEVCFCCWRRRWAEEVAEEADAGAQQMPVRMRVVRSCLDLHGISVMREWSPCTHACARACAWNQIPPLPRRALLALAAVGLRRTSGNHRCGARRRAECSDCSQTVDDEIV